MSARLGRYELLRPLGRGGMAEVFLARYVGPEGFEKRLVIKKVLPQLSDDPNLLRMFFEEAKTHVALSHGNLVSVFDFGRVGNDYFIAMEHVDGADLGAILLAEQAAQRPLAPELVAYIGIELCRGLAYVHRRGLVHRDVSPRNVLVSTDGEIKLSDFGLVLTTSSDVSGIRGTLAYISPEQARGERVDGRADLYSLGVLLAEAAVGRRVRESADQTHALALARAPEPIAIEGVLSDIVARATQARAEDRWRDAEELSAALERVAATLGGGREPSVRAMATKARALAPPLTPLPIAELVDQPATASVNPTSTANYRVPFDAARETYFRDKKPETFVDDVLGARKEPRSRRRALWLIVPMFAVGGVLALRPSPTTAPQQIVALVDAASAPVTPDLAYVPEPAKPAPPVPKPVAAAGTVILRCTPWCVPYVDGKPRGQDGRSHRFALTPGPHRIGGHRLEDHLERAVHVRANETQTVDLTFESKFN